MILNDKARAYFHINKVHIKWWFSNRHVCVFEYAWSARLSVSLSITKVEQMYICYFSVNQCMNAIFAQTDSNKTNGELARKMERLPPLIRISIIAHLFRVRGMRPCDTRNSHPIYSRRKGLSIIWPIWQLWTLCSHTYYVEWESLAPLIFSAFVCNIHE